MINKNFALLLLAVLTLQLFSACKKKHSDDPAPVTQPVTPTPPAPQIMVTTIAGNGIDAVVDGTGSTASFFNPEKIAIDATGNLYVDGISTEKIRKVTPDGIVTTLNLPFLTSYNSLAGLVVDAQSNLLIADYEYDIIYKVNLNNGSGGLFAGAGHLSYEYDGTGQNAGLGSPFAISLAPDGNFYFSCLDYGTVRKATPAGKVTTLVCDEVNQFAPKSLITGDANYVHAIAMDASGIIYYGSGFTHNLIKIDPVKLTYTILAGNNNTTSVDGPATKASFADIVGICFNKAGDLYVADLTCIRKVTANGTVTTIAGSTTENGYQDGVASTSRFSGLQGMVMDTAGDLYVTDQGNRRIRKITFPK